MHFSLYPATGAGRWTFICDARVIASSPKLPITEPEFLRIKWIKFSLPTSLQNRAEWASVWQLPVISSTRQMELFGLQQYMEQVQVFLLPCPNLKETFRFVYL